MAFSRKEINGILIGIQRGDERCKERLFEMTYNHLKGVARLYLYDKTEDGDVVVEAFLKAFAYIHTFDKEKDGYNWLCKIVQNVAYDFNAKRKNYVSIEPYKQALQSQSFEDEIHKKDEVERVLSQLEETDRNIVYMVFFEGKTYQEIGETIGLKKSAIGKRLDKALKQILKEI